MLLRKAGLDEPGTWNNDPRWNRWEPMSACAPVWGLGSAELGGWLWSDPTDSAMLHLCEQDLHSRRLR